MHLGAHYVFLLVTIDRTPKRLNDHAFVLHDCLKSGHSLASLIRICDRHYFMQKGVELTVCKARLIPVFAGSVDQHKKTCTPKGRCTQSVVENGYFAQSFQKVEPAGTTRFTLFPHPGSSRRQHRWYPCTKCRRSRSAHVRRQYTGRVHQCLGTLGIIHRRGQFGILRTYSRRLVVFRDTSIAGKSPTQAKPSYLPPWSGHGGHGYLHRA